MKTTHPPRSRPGYGEGLSSRAAGVGLFEGEPRPRLLCVDDDPSTLSSLARLFRLDSWDILGAASPEEGLRLVDGGDVSLVIADHRMPGMSGVDFLSEVRRRSPETRRVLLTAFPGDAVVGARFSGDVEWLISKPWNDDELRLTVAGLLREARPLRPVGGLRSEIETRLGSFPAFYAPAQSSPEVLELIWRRTLSAELDSPLPALFRERLFAYLSRFGASRYLLFRHAHELRRLGVPADAILTLLEAPPPALEIDVAADLAALARLDAAAGGWPEPGGETERAVFRCAVVCALNEAGAGRSRLALRKALGPTLYNHLLSFLAHVRASLDWTEAHPEIALDDESGLAGILESFRREDLKLAEFLEHHAERVGRERQKTEEKLLDVISGLRRRESDLREDQGQLETRIQDRTTALMAEILERKRAEEELRQSNLILENALEGIARVDAQGRCVGANKAYADLFGRTPEELLGQEWSGTVHPEDRPRLAEAAERMRREGKATVEARALRPDGAAVPMHVVKIRALDREGRPAGHYRFTKDLTEWKQAEEERERLSAQLLQGQKLQAIGQLTAGIAHEINNPVGYLLSNLATLENYGADAARMLDAAAALARKAEEGGDLSAEIRALLRVRGEIDPEFLVRDFPSAISESRQGAERIRDLVKSLREFSHIDEGMKKPTDVVACLEDALRLCWNEIKYKAEVGRDFVPLPLVPAYPQRLSQVFLNLLVNAAQAMEPRGRIRLSARAEGGDVVVRIRDDGVGITAENLKRIFEPFFTTKPVGQGTGLGLYVAYRIVQAHRGRIEATSSPGKGSEFTVRLPIDGGRGEERA